MEKVLCPHCGRVNSYDPTEKENIDCSFCSEEFDALEVAEVAGNRWKKVSEFETLLVLGFINLSVANLPWWQASLGVFILSLIALGLLFALFRFAPYHLPVSQLRFVHRFFYYRLEGLGLISWVVIFLLSLISPQYLPASLLSIFSLTALSMIFLFSIQARAVFSLGEDQRELFENMTLLEKVRALFSCKAFSEDESLSDDVSSFTALEKHFSKAAQEKRAIDEIRSDKMVKKEEHYELEKERENWEFEVSSRYEEWIAKEKSRLRGREGDSFFQN